MRTSFPRVVQITELGTLCETDLFVRLATVAALPRKARARFAVQLRDPELTTRELLDLGTRLRAATSELGVTLLVNDRLDLAQAIHADGVHLGRRSVCVADARSALPKRALVTVACHSVGDVVEAARQRADAALLSPIFASPGKGPAIGTTAIGEANAELAAHGLLLPLIALGGVDPTNASVCFDAGASGVAAIRANLTLLLH